MNTFIGAQNYHLAYIVQEEILPVPQRPSLLISMCYSEEHNSIEEELIAYLSHTHTLYKNDNTQVLKFLEELLRSSSMNPTTQPYKRWEDDRKAWIALR